MILDWNDVIEIERSTTKCHTTPTRARARLVELSRFVTVTLSNTSVNRRWIIPGLFDDVATGLALLRPCGLARHGVHELVRRGRSLTLRTRAVCSTNYESLDHAGITFSLSCGACLGAVALRVKELGVVYKIPFESRHTTIGGVPPVAAKLGPATLLLRLVNVVCLDVIVDIERVTAPCARDLTLFPCDMDRPALELFLRWTPGHPGISTSSTRLTRPPTLAGSKHRWITPGAALRTRYAIHVACTLDTAAIGASSLHPPHTTRILPHITHLVFNDRLRGRVGVHNSIVVLMKLPGDPPRRALLEECSVVSPPNSTRGSVALNILVCRQRLTFYFSKSQRDFLKWTDSQIPDVH